MTKHSNDLIPSTSATQVATQADRREYVKNWIARQQRKLAAGLGGSVLVLPLLAQAQVAGMVDASTLNGVSSIQVGADGVAQITLTNGQIVSVAAAEVTVAANGAVLISAAAAEIVTQVALAAGLGGGLAVGAGALAGAGAAAAAAVAAAVGGGSDAPANVAPPLPFLNGDALTTGGATVSTVFGSFPTLQPNDRVFITIGADGDEVQVTIGAEGQITFPPNLDLSGFQGNQPIRFRVERDVDVPLLDPDGEPVLDPNDDPILITETQQVATGSATVIVDTIPPVVTINDPIAGDDVLNAAERGQGLTLSGTSDAENGRIVTLTLTGPGGFSTTALATVQGGVWSITIPASALAGLPDGAAISISAAVSDAAGNAATPATASFDTDFTATVTLGTVTIETINRFTGVTLSGTTLGVEDGQVVTVTFNGTNYTAPVGAGTWSVPIPASVIAALTDGATIAVSVAVSDIAGNPAAASASPVVNFAGPELAITNREAGDFVNAADAAAVITIEGVTIPGAEVTVTLGSTTATPVTADATTGIWSVDFPVGSVPAAQGPFDISVTTTIGGATGPALTLGQVLDTIAPVVTIDAIAVDNILNLAEQGQPLTISGTSDAENGRIVTLTFNGVDYTDDVQGGIWSVTVPASALTGLADGASIPVSAAVSDLAGNPATPATATVATDFSAAITIADVSITTINEFTGLTISGTAVGVDDGREVTVTLNGRTYTGTVTGEAWSAVVPRADVLVIKGLLDGDDTLTFPITAAVSDTAGNPASANATPTTDFSQPALAILSPEDGDFLNAEFANAGSSLVVSGVAVPGEAVSVTIGAVTQNTTSDADDGTWSVTFISQDLPTAQGDFTVTANSTLGGEVVSFPITLTVDTVLPAQPEVALANDNGTIVGLTNDGTINVTELEAGSIREYSLDGTTWTPFTGTSFAVPGPDGAKSVIVRQTDEAGNISGSSAPLLFDLDTTPPATPTLTLVEDTGTVAGVTNDPFVIVSDLEAGSIREYSLDGTNWTTFTGASFAVPGPDGAKSVIVRQTDEAGNTSGNSAPLAFELDTVAPTAPTPALVEDTGTVALRTSNAEVVVTGLEEGTIREYSLDGITWTPLSGDRFTPGTADGPYTVQVRQIDGAGNISADNLLMFTLDATAPATLTLTLAEDTGVADGITNNPSVTVTGREDGASAEYSLDGGENWVPFSGTAFSLTGTDGLRNVIARQTDGAGNVSDTSTPLIFTLDTTAPEVAITDLSGVLDGGTFRAVNLLDGDNQPLANVRLSGTTGEANGTTVTVTYGLFTQLATVSGGAWVIDIPLDIFDTTLNTTPPPVISAQIVDGAGNSTTTTFTLAAVDLRVPSIDVTAPVADAVLDLTAFEGGLAVTGTTQNVPDNQIVTVELRQGATVVATTTATVTGDAFTGNFTPAQIQGLADQSNFTLAVSVTDGSYPIAATDTVALTTNIPPELTIDPIGVDGALVIEGLGPNVTITGSTRGVQEGQTVELRDGDNALIGSATVQANGTWSMAVPVPNGFSAGDVLGGTFRVANASERVVSVAESVVGYEAADYLVLGGTPVTSGAATGSVEFVFFLDPRTVLPTDFGVAFGEVLSFNTAVATYAPNPAPQYIAGVTPVVNINNAATGSVTFGGVGFLNPNDPETGDPVDLFAARLIRFRLTHVDTASDMVLTVTSQVGGDYTFVYGTNVATTITAGSIDTAIRGRGGDDTIDVSAAGVHTIIFEISEVLNGEDTITGFDLGTALGDRIGFHGLDNTTLRGDGSEFQIITAGSAIGLNTGFVVITTDLPTEADGLAALNALALNANDIIYVLAGDDTSSELLRIVVDGSGALPAADDIEVLAEFIGMNAAQRALFTADNILGFEQFNVV